MKNSVFIVKDAEQTVHINGIGNKDAELYILPYSNGSGVQIQGFSFEEFTGEVDLSITWEELDILVEKLKEWREQNAKPDEPEEGNAG